MSQFTRTITISAKDLGGDYAPTLVLVFDAHPMKGIYEDYFPVAWKMSTFPTQGYHKLTATYINQLVFVNPQVDDDKVISTEPHIDISPGLQTELIENPGPGGTKSFTPTITGDVGNKYIKATNKVTTPQNIGVGFDNGDSPLPTALVFDNVGYGHHVTAQFTPTLSAYITEDYQENSVVRGEIRTPVIWRENLVTLQETSIWKLKLDPVSGKYSITAVEDIAK